MYRLLSWLFTPIDHLTWTSFCLLLGSIELLLTCKQPMNIILCIMFRPSPNISEKKFKWNNINLKVFLLIYPTKRLLCSSDRISLKSLCYERIWAFSPLNIVNKGKRQHSRSKGEAMCNYYRSVCFGCFHRTHCGFSCWAY